MAKSVNQKKRILLIEKFLNEDTDEENGITVSEIINRLEMYDITVERKTVYNDFEELRDVGMDIISTKDGHTTYYHLASRTFELPELKLLADSVASSKFITEKKSRELIKKIEGLTSKREANQLQRQILISGRVKTMNEGIYINVDTIHDAIAMNRQIQFRYFQWNLKKEPEFKRNGDFYTASPIHLMWDNDNYYMIAYDSELKIIKHYRVDKMKNISILENTPRDGREIINHFDASAYTNRLFGMFGGDEAMVTLYCDIDKIGIIIDRFGRDVSILKKDSKHFTAHVKVALSDQFLSWVIGIGGGIKITAPDNVVERMKKMVEELRQVYDVE